MNGEVMNGSVMNVVCYERGMWWTGLLWAGLLRTLSVLSGLLWLVWYERVCFEREPSDRNFVNDCYLTTDTLELSKLGR